ncbi:acyltransferase ChoActase/COT/CPT [Polychytrium aggregatum]|uniref:acyltransferase ChoActase/COT/CPT n=1 Tax=Polychytrium aggregatum TaxID=110093 RepID=UPI0022FEE618|nr:acyltransferase ChoActase/COT/CPT [Polychytrium aggregatum]KAI9206459.1 acyltransferase ChoActase/COT/CPT [Polychytrium aggregatum]
MAQPRLPIPDLDKTMALFLRSLEPMLSPGELHLAAERVRKFTDPDKGVGQLLQGRLKQHDSLQKNSWIEDWWLRLAYHSWREPLMVHSNWYVVFRDEVETLCTSSSYGRFLEAVSGAPLAPSFGIGDYSAFQIRRAAGFIANLLKYKDLIDRNEIPTEPGAAKGNVGLCLDQYRWLFGVTRVPRPECDENVGPYTNSRHIVVLVKGQIYRMDICDPFGSRLGLVSLQRQLEWIVRDVEGSTRRERPIGLLTAIHRDRWAQMYSYIRHLSPENASNLEIIQTSLFAIALDDYRLSEGVTYIARNCFHGFRGRNRWFDKSFTVIVSSDGHAGLNGEHSPCDALVPCLMADFILKNEPAQDSSDLPPGTGLPQPHRLRWSVDQRVEDAIHLAQEEVDGIISNSDVRVMEFAGFGSTFIKQKAKVSPDAYMQMALQLAFYRMHGRLPAVYETASVRRFIHGRTETCRSLSSESAAFVRSFDQTTVPGNVKVGLLRKACSAHVAYLSTASKAHGCDRHMLGLKMCINSPGEAPLNPESVRILTDPLYAQSSHWQLSTSGLFSNVTLLATGFGAVAPDGYGLNYIINPNIIRAGIESKHGYPNTSTPKFIEHLQRALVDLRQLIEDTPDASKL